MNYLVFVLKQLYDRHVVDKYSLTSLTNKEMNHKQKRLPFQFLSTISDDAMWCLADKTQVLLKKLKTYVQLNIFTNKFFFISKMSSESIIASVLIIESSSGIYLIVMSFVDILQLIFNYVYGILVEIEGLLTSWLAKSLFNCKIRIYMTGVCGNIVSSCLCLAAIDQYMATLKYSRLQQWSRSKITKRICILMCLF